MERRKGEEEENDDRMDKSNTGEIRKTDKYMKGRWER
jgi:hypothetical protein